MNRTEQLKRRRNARLNAKRNKRPNRMGGSVQAVRPAGKRRPCYTFHSAYNAFVNRDQLNAYLASLPQRGQHV